MYSLVRHLEGAFLVGQIVKKSACNKGDPGLIPGWENPLEEKMATHSSILAWRIPMDRGARWATVYRATKSQTWLTHNTHTYIVQFSSVQLLSCVLLFVTPWTAARQASLSITNCQSLLKLKSVESVMPSNHLILCCPLLLLPSIFPSIRVCSNESALRIRWPKYWSFSFNISPSNEYSGLISFRLDWLDLLAAQGTLKSLLQHHSSKASILQCSSL